MLLAQYSSRDAYLFLFCLAFSTNLFEIVWTSSAPAALLSAYTFHSKRFFSGWNCTAYIGQSLPSNTAISSSLQAVVVVAMTFQNAVMFLLLAKQAGVTPYLLLQQVMPTPFVRRVRTSSEISSKMQLFAPVNWIVWMMAVLPLIAEMALESKPEVRQASSWKPRQVPHTGKVLPFLFCSIAQFNITCAFLVHLLAMLIASPPPGKSTPFTFESCSRMADSLLQPQMGTTCAPDISMNLTYEAAMQVYIAIASAFSSASNEKGLSLGSSVSSH